MMGVKISSAVIAAALFFGMVVPATAADTGDAMKSADIRTRVQRLLREYDDGHSDSYDHLPVYRPERDAAPNEGIGVKETNLTFVEPLSVRLQTKNIIIHHVGIPDGDTSAAAIHKAHLQNGWAGIGYHYVIRKDGTIERGRPLATVGAHSYGNNYTSVGINVAGNFDKEYPTKGQLKSLVRLVAAVCNIYGLAVNEETVVGHRDKNETDCPGAHLYPLLGQIRTAAAKELRRMQRV